MGTKEIKEIVVAGARVADLLESLADGLDFGDLKDALAAARTVPAAIKDAVQALEEYKMMTDEEALDLEDFVAAEFDLTNDTVEMYIEKALEFVISLHSFFKAREA